MTACRDAEYLIGVGAREAVASPRVPSGAAMVETMADLAEPTERLALPEAHSMDTTWFAVDELGHVAMFRADAGDPVPSAAWRGLVGRLDDVFFPLLADVDPEALSYEAADVLSGEQRGTLAEIMGEARLLTAPPSFDQSLHGVLLQLRTLDGARERLAPLGLHILPSREGGYAWGELLESPRLRELWREGWVVRAALGHEFEPSRMGMFWFGYKHEEVLEAVHGPGSLPPNVEGAEADDVYLCWEAPRVPVRVHALPTSLRSRLAAVRFPDLDFRAIELLRVNAAASVPSP